MTRLSKSKLEELNQYAKRENRETYHIIKNGIILTLGFMLYEVFDVLVYGHNWDVMEILKKMVFAIVMSIIVFGHGAWRNERLIKKHAEELNQSKRL